MKKQSGGHGQFAIAWLRVEPTERGDGLRVRRQDRRRRHPAPVPPRGREGRARDRPSTAACSAIPVVDVRVTCFDGKHHPVDSSEMAFKTAASLGLQGGDGQGRPDPARAGERARRHGARGVPGRHHGRPQRQARPHPGLGRVGNGEVEIVAMVPTSEILRYTIDLRSMTGGRGRFTATPLALRPGARPPRREGAARRPSDARAGVHPRRVRFLRRRQAGACSSATTRRTTGGSPKRCSPDSATDSSSRRARVRGLGGSANPGARAATSVGTASAWSRCRTTTGPLIRNRACTDRSTMPLVGER